MRGIPDRERRCVALSAISLLSVEREIQLQHVDACPAEETEQSAARCAPQSARARVLIGMPRVARHARSLQVSGSRGNVRVEAGAAGGHHLRGNLPAARLPLRTIASSRSCHGLQVVGIRRPVVAAAGRRGVVVHGRRPRMKVLGPLELLRDQPRADDRAVAAANQAALGLRPEMPARPMPHSTT